MVEKLKILKNIFIDIDNISDNGIFINFGKLKEFTNTDNFSVDFEIKYNSEIIKSEVIITRHPNISSWKYYPMGRKYLKNDLIELVEKIKIVENRKTNNIEYKNGIHKDNLHFDIYKVYEWASFYESVWYEQELKKLTSFKYNINEEELIKHLENKKQEEINKLINKKLELENELQKIPNQILKVKNINIEEQFEVLKKSFNNI